MAETVSNKILTLNKLYLKRTRVFIIPQVKLDLQTEKIIKHRPHEFCLPMLIFTFPIIHLKNISINNLNIRRYK